MGEGSVGLSPIEAERQTLFWFNAVLIASNGTDSRLDFIQGFAGASVGFMAAGLRESGENSINSSAGTR